MVNNHRKQKKQWKNIEETDVLRGLQGRMIHPEMEDPMHPADGYRHKVDVTDETNNACTDLGKYYIARTIDSMEEWHSKPREGAGQHVSDVCYCPRQNVFRIIDRRPIGAKNVSIYSAGKAVHEAYQLLFRSDK